MDAFNLYLGDSQYARPKSAKQLLTTLGNGLRKYKDRPEIRDALIRPAQSYLEDEDNPRHTKAYLQSLTHFMSKDLLDPSAIDRALPGLQGNSDVQAPPEQSSDVDTLLSSLFGWASKEDFGPVAGRCISVVLEKYKQGFQKQDSSIDKAPDSLNEPIWSSALNACLWRGDVDIEQLRLYIFPILFKQNISQYINFLREHGLDEVVATTPAKAAYSGEADGAHLLHAALQSGKELGLICETDGQNLHDDGSVLYLPIRSYHSLAFDQHRGTRLTGLHLVVTSHSATRPFLPSALRLLQKSLPVFFADTDANFRSEVFSLVQKLMDRLRAITAVLARAVEAAKSKASADDTASTTLSRHREFVDWLLRCLTWELRPTASYQRHISALKCLSIIARSGVDTTVPMPYWSKSASAETKWPFSVSVVNSAGQRLLLDLLMDPFDDVRQTAASILSMYAQPTPGLGSKQVDDMIRHTLEQAEKTMPLSGRADQAEGVAHMYSLLAQTSNAEVEASATSGATEDQNVVYRLISDLEQMLDNAGQSLTAAAKRYPMHGLLTSIRFVLAQQSAKITRAELERIEICLRRLWETVRPVLCNDAPEGYELEDAGELSGSSSKDVLSYCWRALKESSLLLGTIVIDKSLRDSMVIELGDLCFSQLAELRHRGAFSTVAQTWIVCCNRAAALPFAQQEKSFLERSYDKAFDILKNKTTINTRRSAGIPSLLCGLLIADKTGQVLARAFEDLSAIATETVDTRMANESSLPQVHALNCIKDVLKNSRLGEQSERFVSPSLSLAAVSLRSEAWAIRNCGLMLFRAVIDRLLGTSDAYLEDDALSSHRISAQQHPGLLDTVLELLQIPEPSEGGPAARFEGVFPALQMLQRIEIPEAQQQRARDLVLVLTASPSWHVRDKAARTYAALLSNATSPIVLRDTLLTRTENENALHGNLLCRKYVIKAARTMTAAKLSRSSRNCVPLTSEPWYDAISQAIVERHDEQLAKRHPVARATWSDVLVEYVQLGYQCRLVAEATEMSLDSEILRKLDFLNDLHVLLEAHGPDRSEWATALSSVSRALAFQLLLGQETSLFKEFPQSTLPSDTIVLLGQQDADACSELWQTLRTHTPDHIVPLDDMDLVVIPAARQILSGPFHFQLKCEVQRFLLCLADNATLSNRIVVATREIGSPLEAGSNQTYADQWLQLRALVIDRHLRAENYSLSHLSDFISSCREAIAGDGFFSREAAASALSRMRYLWPILAAETNISLACDTYLTIYDLLNDDDEDIRLLAASTVSRILRSANPTARTTHFEPIVASQRLLAHMLTHLRHSRAFASEAFPRAFDTASPVVDLLNTYSQPETALFAQEKQNLYIDPAREVRAWSQVLLQLSMSSIPKQLIRSLAKWVDEGLQTLTSHFIDENGNDDGFGRRGALDWTSKPEVFVLGLQVFYGVEVLFAYLGKGGSLPVKGSEIWHKLAMFQRELEEREGNVLWRWEVERVLKEVVMGRLKLAAGLMGWVSDKVRSS